MPPGPPPFAALPVAARRLVVAVAVLAVAAVAGAQLVVDHTGNDLLGIAVCLPLCVAGSFFEVRAPRGYWLQPHLPVFVAGALLLSPAVMALLAVAVFLPGALVRAERWYRPTYNITVFMLAGVVAGLASDAVSDYGTGHAAPLEVVGLFAGSLALVAVNHALVSAVTELSRGVSPLRALGSSLRLHTTMGVGLAFDLALALTGASIAALWIADPVALPLVIGPAALVTASLWVPTLRHSSRTDSKTGLFNYGHVRHLMGVAIASADRDGTPASVLMIDLDHLRAVNNRHGHLAGDALIGAVAQVIAERTGGRGSAGRFGGEEFCAVLPGLGPEEAAIVAEEVRAQVAALRLPDAEEGVATSTVSVGVAAFPEHGGDVDTVLHAADMALYDAKLGGRNRVRVAPPRSAGDPPELPAEARDSHSPVADSPAVTTLAPASRRWIVPYTTLLVALAAGVGLLADPSRVLDEPLLFAGLLVAVLVLDAVRIDLFERLQTSPAALPVLVLAAAFGPLGPIAAEALIFFVRLVRRTPLVRASFDLGALSLAGAAAAGTYASLTAAGLDQIPAGVAAGIAYYAVNTPLLAIVIGLSSGTSPLANFREQLSWLLPHYAAFGALAGLFMEAYTSTRYGVFMLFGLPTAVLWFAEQQYVKRSRSGVEELRRSHAELQQANGDLHRLLADNQALITRLQTSYLSTITSLARTIEAKDPYTGDHTERVARVAATLAAELGFSAEELRAVEVGAVIHDIGKIGVPDATLLKPGPLNESERREIERHPEISSYIVAELDVPAIVKQMVRSHHERFDGNGYPDRLQGEEIPLAARILTVADALDAMTSDRPYRKALPMHQALSIIEEHTGTQFCPTVVDALRRRLEADGSSTTTPPALRLVV